LVGKRARTIHKGGAAHRLVARPSDGANLRRRSRSPPRYTLSFSRRRGKYIRLVKE